MFLKEKPGWSSIIVSTASHLPNIKLIQLNTLSNQYAIRTRKTDSLSLMVSPILTYPERSGRTQDQRSLVQDPYYISDIHLYTYEAGLRSREIEHRMTTLMMGKTE